MFGQEMVTCLTVAGATAGFRVWVSQKHFDRRQITSATLFFVCGLLTLVFLVISASMLAQVLLLIPGVMCVGESAGVARGRECARKRAFYSSAFILVAGLPLIGLAMPALLLTVAAGVALLAYEASRRLRRPKEIVPSYPAQVETSGLAAESCY